MKVNVLVALLAALALTGCGGDPEPQTVPDLRGERLDVAERRLDDRGLDFERVGGGSLGIVVRSRWTVCDQEPAPGLKATKVRLIVERDCPPVPPAERLVPDLVGLRVGLAETRLERRSLGYDVESLFEQRFDVPPSWIVCEQDPPAGKRASRVVLFAARRCEEAAAEPVVPNVVGEDLDDAQTLLDERGIGYAVLPGDVEPEERRLWEVCEQDPAPGEEGAFVDLHVARSCPD